MSRLVLKSRVAPTILIAVLLVLGTLIFLASCGPKVDITPLADLPMTPVTKEVVVYLGPDRVDRPYEELAIISIDDEGWDRQDSELIDRMRDEAREFGAEAVILLDRERTEGGGVFVGNVWVTSEHKVIRGIAIRFIDPAKP